MPHTSSPSPDNDAHTGRTALIAGSVAAGAYLTGTVARWWQRKHLRPPEQLPKAVAAESRTFDLMEGRTNYYVRPGTGTPIVLLHSFNAAASTYEMKPIFDHLTATTDRPIYALDWLGFGRSARPPANYRPALFQRQLRRFLSEHVQAPADVIALSLGAEYAALVTQAVPVLTRRLVLLNPTGLDHDRGPSSLGRFVVRAASGMGAFELIFYRLTRRKTLRSFYERQVFLHPKKIPDALVEYAYTTTHATGAHRAPRRFVDGSLFPTEAGALVYARLYRPTLLITPEDASGTIQSFDRIADVLVQNRRDLHHERLASGLLPQWENPDLLFPVLDEFLA